MPQTQPRPGHLRDTSDNPMRDRDGSVPKHDELGYPRKVSDNPGDAGQESEYVYEAEGYVYNEKAKSLPTRRIQDGVKDTGEGY
jgi:hypothetical protein